MKHIMEFISDHIDEELEDARTYAKAAVNHASENPEAHDLFMMLSKEEVTHAQRLRTLAENMISKKPNDESIPEMYIIYKYLKDKQTDKMAEILAMYNIK